MDASFNIVDLIENNPIARLSNTYQNNLLTKIKSKFTDNEQQLFVASFYSFLNYDSNTDFVIDLDNVWKWLGFYTKQKAKDLLEKYFIINKDYIKSLTPQGKRTGKTKGGHNREVFLLTIVTFKKFCLKAGTKKADEIHDYYIKLEETLQEVIYEESNELKLQLEEKNEELKNVDNDKKKLREKTILEQFPNNMQCVYYGIIDNVSNKNEKLIKFGNSNNLKDRVKAHKNTYLNFCLINAFKVENKLQIETAIKEHALFIERHRVITLKNKKYVELLNAEGLSFTELNTKIKEIITNIEYSPENYIRILEANKLLKSQLENQHEKDNTNDLILLTSENKKLKIVNLNLMKKVNALKKRTGSIHDEDEDEDEDDDEDHDEDDDEDEDEKKNKDEKIKKEEIENYGLVMKELHPRAYPKSQYGLYIIDGKTYETLCGSREDVWKGKSYKTTGGLIKNNLIINNLGKIVSKRKSITEQCNNKFEKINQAKIDKANLNKSKTNVV